MLRQVCQIQCGSVGCNPNAEQSCIGDLELVLSVSYIKIFHIYPDVIKYRIQSLLILLLIIDYSNKSPCPTKELYTAHACKYLTPIGAERLTTTCMYGIFPKSEILK